MAFKSLSEFVEELERNNELLVVREFVDPVLEIADFVDRFSKQEGSKNKAIFFTNTGTDYPILINALGSEKRICSALNCSNLDEHKNRIEALFTQATSPKKTLAEKLSFLPLLKELNSWLPKHIKNASCQEVVEKDVDLSKLPILQCWKHDAGRFITFPMVITKHPETGVQNMGMYRMQVLDKQTTGMHWHKGKTGENHYEAYKALGKRMPVSVALGGDPVNIFSATAPLPENVDENLLSGFLRRQSVRLVKCVTNDLEVPADADFVLEGYIDTSEDKFMEGPFGDHTGFYSLPDLYPKFHITCITHKKNAVYPATIVGIPPMEDAWIGKATERIFLAPIKMLICPDLIDYCMPFEGVAHNLVIAKINKKNEGQAQRVVNAFWGAGQMSNNKTIVIVDESCDIFDRQSVVNAIEMYFHPESNMTIMNGPLDVLDHSCKNVGYGSKMAIDATKKNERNGKIKYIAVNQQNKQSQLSMALGELDTSILVLHDDSIDEKDSKSILWSVLNNYNPKTDCTIKYVGEKSCLIIDGATKSKEEQVRDLPNPVLADDDTIQIVDRKFAENKLEFIPSPSLQYKKMMGANSAWRYNKVL